MKKKKNIAKKGIARLLAGIMIASTVLTALPSQNAQAEESNLVFDLEVSHL